MRVIGLMSGTSYDAIEAAAADITVEGDALVLRPLGAVSLPYPDDVRGRISAALPPAAVTMEDVCRLDTAVGQAFAQAAVHAVGALCP
ncbi:anhydro-N-acetylmuramic acid kinase, partial [Streptomyces sp. NPDC127574]